MTALLLAVCSSEGRGQTLGKNIEVVGTGTALLGVARLNTELGSRVRPYAGVRLDSGLQFATTSIGIGGRLWLLDGGEELVGGGFEAFLSMSRRLNGGIHTSVRGTLGITGEDVQTAGDLHLGGTGGGVIWSAGVEHEFYAFASRFLVSADLVIPPSPDPNGRKRPALELGIGFRERFFQRIRPL